MLDNCAPARLTRMVPPFSSVAQRQVVASNTLSSQSEQPQTPIEAFELEADLATCTAATTTVTPTTSDVTATAPMAPTLPSDWLVASAVPQSFSRLPLLAVSMWLLWLLFAADVFVCYEVLTGRLSLSSSSSSSLTAGDWTAASASALLITSPLCVALVGVLLTLELMGLSLGWRLYVNAHYSLTRGCWLLLAVCYGPVLAAAIALQLPFQSAPLWLSLCIVFVPALSLHCVHIFCQWRSRDYRVAVESSFTRRVQIHPSLSAAQRHDALLAVRRYDGSMLLCCCVQAALVLAFSGCPGWPVLTLVQWIDAAARTADAALHCHTAAPVVPLVPVDARHVSAVFSRVSPVCWPCARSPSCACSTSSSIRHPSFC